MAFRRLLDLIVFLLIIAGSLSPYSRADQTLPTPSIVVTHHPGGGKAVTFTFTPPGPVRSLHLAGTFNHWSSSAHPMTGPDREGRWALTLPLPDGSYAYKFVINASEWVPDPLNPLKISDGHEGYNSILLLGPDARPADAMNLPPRVYTASPDFKTPEWARHVVWYQIFPERFRNGRKSNDPDGPLFPWRASWFTIQPWEKGTFYDPIAWERRCGGDLQGIEKKLDYLQDLGVSAIYLNPVFEAPSLHKYDAVTYLHIDDNFGVKGITSFSGEDWLDPSTWRWTPSDKVFLNLVRECRKRGMHVIIDGVFNHVSDQNLAFLDVKRKGRHSSFTDWFDVISWKPFVCKGWADFAMMPEFHEGPDGFPPSLEKHLMDVTTRWMDPNGDGDPSDGVDGWRLDVPFDINRPFWERWRRHVKSINPDAYLTGEIWGNPGEWLTGDAFDATMNYDFSRISQNFFIDRKNRITASVFHQRLNDLLSSIPEPARPVMQNLFDSHDTDRLASQIKNPDRPYDGANRLQEEDGKNYDVSRPRREHYEILRLMAAFQMTWVGAPMIYNGTEVGMFGPDDPSNRKPMLWSDLEPYENPEEDFVDRDLFQYFQRLVAIRNTCPALREGLFHKALADDAADVYAFWRWFPEPVSDLCLVVLNNSPEFRDVSIPGVLSDDASSSPLMPLHEGVVFDDLLASPAKIVRARMPHAEERWNTMELRQGKEISIAVREGAIRIGLKPRTAAILQRRK